MTLKRVFIGNRILKSFYEKILINVKVPKLMEIISINLRGISSFLIFFVPQASKGVAIKPAIAKIIASVKSINRFNKIYKRNPTTEIINSLRF